MKIFQILAFMLISVCAKAQTSDAEHAAKMKTEFQLFYNQLQKGDFEKAVDYVSEDYIKAMYSWRNQMKGILQSNFSNMLGIPNLEIKQTGVEIIEPRTLIHKDEKVFGVLTAVMTIQFSGIDDAETEEAKDMFQLIARMSKGRYTFGPIQKLAKGKSGVEVKDNRLVAAIYDEVSGKYSFAMAELGLQSTFEKFLPAVIVSEMEKQL